MSSDTGASTSSLDDGLLMDGGIKTDTIRQKHSSDRLRVGSE